MIPRERSSAHRLRNRRRCARPVCAVGGSVSGALNWFGDPLRVALERHFALFLGLIAITIVVGFWIAARML